MQHLYIVDTDNYQQINTYIAKIASLDIVKELGYGHDTEANPS